MEPRITDLTDTSCYKIDEKGIQTPAMPLEQGLLVYRHFDYQGLSGEELACSLGTIIRWALLYELLSIMEIESKSKSQFEIHKKNSIPFVTEWLDDLTLLNWWFVWDYPDPNTRTYGDFVYWDGTKLKDYPYILRYCKHCFKKIEQPIPINSLHKDCLKNYFNPKRNKKFKKNYEIVSKVESKLATMLSKIGTNEIYSMHKGRKPGDFLYSDEANKQTILSREDLFCELNTRLDECRRELLTIAKQWYKRLEKVTYIFSPIIPIESRDILDCPDDTYKEYSELNRLLNDPKIRGDLKSIFDSLYQSHGTTHLNFVDLLRILFYKKNQYFFVAKSKV